MSRGEELCFRNMHIGVSLMHSDEPFQLEIDFDHGVAKERNLG